MKLRSLAGVATFAALGVATGCQDAGAPLAPADSYLVYEPAAAGGGAPAAEGAASLRPLLREVALDDVRAAPVHRAAMDGFVGEMLRTDYLLKQLIRDGWQGRAFSAEARHAAAEPTVLVLAGSRALGALDARAGAGLDLAGWFGRRKPHPNARWIEIGDDPSSDPAFVQTASGRIARMIAGRLSEAGPEPGAAAAGSRALIEGYAWAMEVIGREWRVGEGPRGTVAPDAGTGTQRERFATVRQNGAVRVPGDPATLVPAGDMVRSPGVIATVIYRFAQARSIGHRVGPPEIYAPFVGERVPPGVSPAAVLGPIRNFQTKLLVAWAGAILAGKPPRDLLDLVEAYVGAMPAERAEVLRIFAVTTYGATIQTGGVSARPQDADQTLPTLTALAAEVAAGRRTLRDALPVD